MSETYVFQKAPTVMDGPVIEIEIRGPSYVGKTAIAAVIAQALAAHFSSKEVIVESQDGDFHHTLNTLKTKATNALPFTTLKIIDSCRPAQS